MLTELSYGLISFYASQAILAFNVASCYCRCYPFSYLSAYRLISPYCSVQFLEGIIEGSPLCKLLQLI